MKFKPKTSGVSAARRVALEILRRVEAEGAFTSLALSHALDRASELSPEDRGLATELVYGTLRWRRRIDFALAAYSLRPLAKVEPSLLRILRMSAYQILFLDRIPVWAAVDEGTSLADVLRGRRAAGFVNGVLRGLAAAKDRIEWPDPAKDGLEHSLCIRHSFPDWMVEHWLPRFGVERLERFLAACNEPAWLWVRANTLRVQPAALCDLLSASGLNATAHEAIPGALRIQERGEIRRFTAHEAGMFHIQDAAAQVICHLLDPQPGERILDACAAPGGKTATLAELMKDEGEIVAADAHPARLTLVRKLAERLGVHSIRIELADLSAPVPPEWGTFDRVLLDAPCSALGVLRRHPEAKWRLMPDDLPRMAQVQHRLLENVCGLIRPGGYLVYSVCTFSEPEGRGQVERLLREHPEFECVVTPSGKRYPWNVFQEPGGILETWPDRDNIDGFFAVKLRRRV